MSFCSLKGDNPVNLTHDIVESDQKTEVAGKLRQHKGIYSSL
jgi:hypothetical protein